MKTDLLFSVEALNIKDFLVYSYTVLNRMNSWPTTTKQLHTELLPQKIYYHLILLIRSH